jgi:multidrug efflux pump subunit AcrA (membrane-fusion protein)
MKKILLIVLAVVVAAGLVALFVYRQQSGYTKVLTAKIVKQDLATVVSGTGQIKAKYYVNLGATAMGRVTHFAVKEGDTVKKGEVVATIEHVQQEANVHGQQATIAAAKTDISSYCRGKDRGGQRRPRQGRSGTEEARLGPRPGPLQGRHHGQAGLRRQEGRLRPRRGLRVAGRAGSSTRPRRRLIRPRAPGNPGGHPSFNQDLLDKTIAIAPLTAS